MKANALKAFSVLAFASAANAVSTQLIKNYCSHTVYLTLTNDSGATDGPFDLPTQQAYLNEIVGQGNDCKVSWSPDIFSPTTAVFILGTSTYNGILYWGVSNANGDPFDGQAWNVSSSGSTEGVCSGTTTYDGQVHACQDQDVTLTLNIC